jgi:hypothetical protein
VAGGDVGAGLSLRSQRVVVVLAADGVAGNQLLEARRLQRLGAHVGLGAQQRGLGACQAGLVRRRIDLEQALAFTHVGAFAELALEHDAVHARAHLRHAQGIHTAGQFDGHGHARGTRGRDGDGRGRQLRLRRLGRWRIVALACAQWQGKQQAGHQRRPTSLAVLHTPHLPSLPVGLSVQGRHSDRRGFDAP